MRFPRPRGAASSRRSPGPAVARRGGRSRSPGARPTREAARPAGSGRRWPRILGRFRLTPPRAAALLAFLACVGSFYGLSTTSAFTLARTELPTLRWTTAAALDGALATTVGTNLFEVRTAPIEHRLKTLPAVADAHVRVSLPDTLVVEVVEREPILIWAVGETRFLVDRDGVIFAVLPPGSTSSPDLTVIADSRPESAVLGIGSSIDPVDLDAATRLGSLTPADVGSAATSLVITVTEANGFVAATVPPSWVAIFGLYTPTLRTPAMIPGQVRLLRSLLAGREDGVAQVILADADSGTYVPRATPAP